MKIITRQQAITDGLNKYFTGEPCRNGHTAERYTHSSTCQSCITQYRPQNNSPRERSAVVELRRKQDLIKIRVELNFKDVPTFKSAMWMAAFLIDQSVTEDDLLTNNSPKALSHERALYTFRTFQANHSELYKMAKDLERARAISDPIQKIPMDPKMAEAIANAQESPSALPLKARLTTN